MRIVLMLLLVSCTLKLTAQNKINSYQYWFDGQYNNAVSQTITPAATYNLVTQVNTNTLLNGLHVFNIKFRDDSSRLSHTLSAFFYKSFPVTGNVTVMAYQYWFDQNYSGAIIPVTGPNSGFNFENDIGTEGLLNGLHVIHIRFKDNTSRWSETLSHFFYKAPATGSTGSINAYQFWFDQNFEGAFTQNLSPGAVYTLSAPLNAGSLLNGLHVLHVRFLDGNNRWSSTHSQFFYKAALPGSPGTIIAYQYWFDQNYAGVVHQNLTAGSMYTLSAPINTAGLLTGLHVLNLRFLDNSNKWSSTASQFFYIPGAITGNNLHKFQYWFDQDYAGAVEQNITPSATYNLAEQVTANSLLTGLHAISVRFMDTRGKWSSTTTQFFYKDKPPAAAENKIAAYRYWFDDRDSILNLVAIAPFMNPLILNQTVSADGIDSGQHVIHFQFQDMNGKWSMVSSDTATVIAKATYTFNGNGNWSNANNWVNKIKPPSYVSGSYKIVIDPVAGGQCILDVGQQITTGAIFTIRSGKSFVIPGNLNINY
jgi:hypothetical protein